ncbi:hypothetical protein GCM10009827_031900 [Dactylosporangium maewongense]|uniref:Uncharacterized protein n=1 Tax=Dactylosporangium maewongense TaxID=634393 RepID=A0ABN2AA11_9ACTN
MGRFLAAAAAVIVGLFVVGALAIWLFKVLMSVAFYLIVGAAVVGGGIWLYNKARRGLSSGGRNQRRIEAFLATRRGRIR